MPRQGKQGRQTVLLVTSVFRRAVSSPAVHKLLNLENRISHSEEVFLSR